MKNSKLLVVIFIALISFSSCKDEDPFDPNAEGEFTLSFTSNASGLKKVFESSEPTNLLVSIKNSSGEYVFTNEKIELFKMNNEYISSPMTLTVGDYELTDFMVVDDNNNVLYVAPKEGSVKAYLVNDPLSIEYTIEEDDVRKVTPEVISTENISPEDFGYGTFSFNVVETINFLTTVFVYNESLQNFELTDAEILIKSNSETLFDNTLDAVTNLITLNSGYEIFNIIVSKEGYENYNETFTKDSLEKHFSNPLTIILGKEKTLVLQPNAEEGKDAEIRNCMLYDWRNTNFGDNSEFTANAWTNSGSESTLRSLIDFDLSSLPDNASIIEAKLNLYVSEITFHGPGHSQLSGSNECYLQRVTSTWDESTVTWNTQPTTTTVNQVELLASASDMQDYELIVTELIKDMLSNPDSSFGFMLKLQNETYYRRMLFASSDNEVSSTWPTLTIKYE